MEYEVEVIETLKRKKSIDAEDLEHALEKMKNEYDNCNIILNENDFVEVDFREAVDDSVNENHNFQELLQELLNAGGSDAGNEYSKGWDEAMEEAYNIVCKHLNHPKEKVKEDNASKIL